MASENPKKNQPQKSKGATSPGQKVLGLQDVFSPDEFSLIKKMVEKGDLPKDNVAQLLKRCRESQKKQNGFNFFTELGAFVSKETLQKYQPSISQQTSKVSAPKSEQNKEVGSPEAHSNSEPTEGTKKSTQSLSLNSILVLAACGLLVLGVSIGLTLTLGGFLGGSSEQTRPISTLLNKPFYENPSQPGELLGELLKNQSSLNLADLHSALDSDALMVRINAARVLTHVRDKTAIAKLETWKKDSDELYRLVALFCLDQLNESGVKESTFESLEISVGASRPEVRLFAILALGEYESLRSRQVLIRALRSKDRITQEVALKSLARLDPASLRDYFEDKYKRSSSKETIELAHVSPNPKKPSKVSPSQVSSSKSVKKVEVDVPKEVEIKEVVDGGQVGDPISEEEQKKPTPKVEAKPVPKPKPPSPVVIAQRRVPGLIRQEKYSEAIELLKKALVNNSEPDPRLLWWQGQALIGLEQAKEGIDSIHLALKADATLFDAYYDLTIGYTVLRQAKNAHQAFVMALRLGFRNIKAIRSEPRLAELRKLPQFKKLMEHYFNSPFAGEPEWKVRFDYASRLLTTRMRKEKDPFLRALHLLKFSEPGGPEATELLSAYMKDHSEIVRRVLSEILSREKDLNSIRILTQKFYDTKSVYEREGLMWALAKTPGSPVVDCLLAGLKDKNLKVSIAAAEALGDRPDRRSVPDLIALLKRTKRGDRLRVREVLIKVTGKTIGLEPIDWMNFWEANSQKVKIGKVHNPCDELGATNAFFIPEAFAERTGRARIQALKKRGGTPKTEQAMKSALRWLAQHQNKDGRWDTDEWALTCPEREAWEKITKVKKRLWDTQITGIALMAFLGAGHTHRSGEYRETVRKGLKYLRSRQAASGLFVGDHHSYVYRSHPIATIAVTEAYIMTRDCELRPVVERAVQAILRRQFKNGGWGWFHNESRTTFSGWNLLALLTAQAAGIKIPATNLVVLRDYLDRMTLSKTEGHLKAGFAYEILQPNAKVGESLSIDEHEEVRSGGGLSTTVVGLFCRTLLKQSSKDARVSGALNQLMKGLPKHGGRFKNYPNEYHFFGTQAALFHGGAVWGNWNKAMKPAFLDSIISDQKDCERGSWMPYGDFGRIWSTAMGALTLQSYYRFSADVLQD